MKYLIWLTLGTLCLIIVNCSGSTDVEADTYGVAVKDVPILINEFMASNQLDSTREDSILDESGAAADWIELYNKGDKAFNLKGLYLSDDSTEVKKFALPDESIPAGGYYLIWADSDEGDGPNHANFKLSAAGEEIILSTSDSEIVDRILYYDIVPAQQPNVSYGRVSDGDDKWGVQDSPTPKSENDP